MASQVKFPKLETENKGKLAAALDDEPTIETPSQKLWRKLREQPLVPIGSLATCGALIAASHYLRTGNRDQFQKALRWRVGLQGVTVLAAVVGTLYLGSGQPAATTANTSADGANGRGMNQNLESIATQPGRPATVSQAQKFDERREYERAQLMQRLREAEQREEAEQKQRAEAALLRPGGPSWLPSDAQRSKPTIGLDRRDRSSSASMSAPTASAPNPQSQPVQQSSMPPADPSIKSSSSQKESARLV